MRFVPFPGRSSSGDQVLGECTVPAGPRVLLTSPVGCLVSRVCCKSTVSAVLCVSSGELISGCYPPSRCQPSRIPERLGWQLGETAHNLVENAVPRAETAPHLPALTVAHLSLCLQWGEGLVHSWLALLWYSLNPLFCEWARLCLSAFSRKA